MSVRPFHHQRPLVAAAAAYGVGVWTGVRLAWRPGLAIAGLLLCALAALLLPRVGRRRVIGVMGVFLFAGMLISGAAAHPRLPPEGKYRVTGVLAQDAAQRADGTAAAYLEQVDVTGDGVSAHFRTVYWTYHPDRDTPFLPAEGDRVTFEGSLYSPSGQMNPYGFDARLYFLQKGVAACLSGARETEVLAHPGRGLLSVTYRLRAWLSQRIQAVFCEDAALPEALLLGIRELLPEDTVRAFSQVGIAHLLAVSGLHVALLAQGLMLLLRRLTGKKTQLAVLSAFLLVYCTILDYSAPVVRASLLMIFAQARRMVRRAPDHLTTLAAAFLLILFIRPLDLFSASFQLSFGAVLAIVVLLPPPEKRLSGRPWLRRLRNSLGVTAAATVGAAIPTIQVFHRVSLIGPLVNPAACLLISLLLPLDALALGVGCLDLAAGQWLAVPLRSMGAWLTGAAEALSRWPLASVRVPFLPWYCVLAIISSLALATKYTVWPRKRKAALAAALLVSAFAAWRFTGCRDVQYLQLAAGQADCTLILDGGQTTLIDAGQDGYDLAAYLLSTGRQADRVVLSHLHTDHCLGLRRLMTEGIGIGEVWLPEGAREQRIDAQALELLREIEASGVPVRSLKAGDRLDGGRVTLEVLWPQGGTVRPGQDANRYSLALLCDLDGVSLLTAGDLTGEYEHYAARQSDVLKVSHHGSKNSTGEEFLSAVMPAAAIVTNSAGRSAALPHPDTLFRLEQRGIRVYCTGQRGAVTVTSRGGRAFITAFLKEKEQP